MKRTYKVCKKCNELISCSNFLRHVDRCHEKLSKTIKCSKCGFEILRSNFERHLIKCDGRGPRKRRDKISQEEYRKKLSESLRLAYLEGRLTGNPKTEEGIRIKREKNRENMLLRYSLGWECRCGRSKKIDYESPIAGLIKVDGSWELKYAKYLDSINVNWKRNKKRFAYINLNGKKSTYCPDFWIEDWNTYVEVKGYETDLDKCKWKQFEYPLKIVRRKEMRELGLL